MSSYSTTSTTIGSRRGAAATGDASSPNPKIGRFAADAMAMVPAAPTTVMPAARKMAFGLVSFTTFLRCSGANTTMAQQMTRLAQNGHS